MLRFTTKSRFCPSPVLDDLVRVEHYAEDGSVVVTFEQPDYSARNFGVASDWSLDAMLKSGVNPETFATKVTAGDRLDSFGKISDFEAAADAILAESDSIVEPDKTE